MPVTVKDLVTGALMGLAPMSWVLGRLEACGLGLGAWGPDSPSLRLVRSRRGSRQARRARAHPGVVAKPQRLHRISALAGLDVVVGDADVGVVLAVVVCHAGRVGLLGDGD